MRSSALAVLFVAVLQAEPLFDGKSLEGWEGSAKWWRVEDGAITGGSITETVPHNDFVVTKKSFHNFDLRLKIKLTGAGGFVNSGVQVRSIRLPDNPEMSGYQVDAGDGWWGKLYDESRRNKVIAEAKDAAAVQKAVRRNDWNDYRIRCEGPRLQSWINGVAAIDYTEPDPKIPLDGKIGIQVHGGGKALVQVKEVVIEELPATPGAPRWPEASLKPAPKTAAQTAITGGPLSPEEELKGFKVPEGFGVELVVRESEGVGKFISVVWDAAGRMWTMTALEYPVDANESAETSRRLFAQGGRDKALVVDNPYGPGPHVPRVFAEGLVMPLGLLPYRDGAFVQYGNDIRFYRDKDGDGRADGHDVVLTGFGTQDSHLFPHQFMRAPGGWILTAQGLFNSSVVRRPGGQKFADGTESVTFNHTKLARFRPDGSAFENLTAGPNNIWGLVTSREGETFLQEANDMGYPVAPYEFGAHYPTGSSERLRRYQPLMPPSTKGAVMGGTGLSGLALAEDRDGWPVAAGPVKTFYVANPITSRVQIVTATPDGAGHYAFEKKPDFLISADPRFRPVAIHFGPDGCLYIVDWYNKIISHNEVPRNHPERDKVRGRIWRVRHKDQPRRPPPDLAKLDETGLLAQLGGANALVSRLAWLEIVDRQAVGLAPQLEKIAGDAAQASDRRLAALWALEGLKKAPAALLRAMAADGNPSVRHEAIRAAEGSELPEAELVALASPLVDDPDPRVRAALGSTLLHAGKPGLALAARLGREPLGGPSLAAYDRAFERYLARWALERHPQATLALLDSPEGAKLDVEARLLATLAIDPKEGARRLLQAAADLKRPLAGEEVALLAGQIGQPAVREALTGLLGNPAQQAVVLAALEQMGAQVAAPELVALVADAARALVQREPTDANRARLARLARVFRIAALEKDVSDWLADPKRSAQDQALGLQALREMGSENVALFRQLATAKDAAVQREAVMALARSRSERALPLLLETWATLPQALRRSALDLLASSKVQAAAVVKAAREGVVGDLDGATLEKLATVLGPDHPDLAALLKEVRGAMQPVLRLSGQPHGYAETSIDLEGPFTVECWVKLDEGINNADHLLGRKGGADFNFYDARFRVYVGGTARDVVIAKTSIKPGVWTHVAATRDGEGRFRIYLNGEMDQDQGMPYKEPLKGLHLGDGNVPGGAGWYAELRVWDVCRAAEELRDSYLQSFAGEAAPASLKHLYVGERWPKLHGGAKVEQTRDYPRLLTAAETRKLNEKFAQFRALAESPGDAGKGKAVFQSICLNCHTLGGAGGKIAPALDGIGHTGLEAMLRNILTPNAAMEAGYRSFRVQTQDGDVIDGFLAAQDEQSVVIQQPNSEPRRVPRAKIRRSAFTNSSLMPEGLLEGLPPDQVRDLISYLKSLR